MGKITRRKAKEVGTKLGINWSKVSLSEFRMGMSAELEHQGITHGSYLLTGRIALDHLKELPDYYTRLKKMERG